MAKRTWSARSLRNLKGVHPDLRRLFDRALQEAPNDFTVIDGLRTIEEQREMVASGASETMNSAHLTGYALDVMFLDKNGNGTWAWPIYDRNAVTFKRLADEMGIPIQWGGDWTTLRDGPHYELHRDHYNWQREFKPERVSSPLMAKAREQGGGIAASASGAVGALGSAVASVSDAPGPIIWAAAALLLVGGLLGMYLYVRSVMRDGMKF